MKKFVIAEARIKDYADKTIKLYTIVYDRDSYLRDTPHSESNVVVHYDTEFAQSLFRAAVDKEKYFVVRGVKYLIWTPYEPSDIEHRYNHFRKQCVSFARNKVPQPIYLYRSICKCITCFNLYGYDSIENRIAKLPTIESPLRAFEIDVRYCKKCDKYFIDSNSLKEYEKKYNTVFFIERKLQDGDGSNHYGDYNKDSILSRHGYSAAANGPSAEQRQQILAKLIDSGIAKKYMIEQHLSGLISARENHYRSQNAITIWQEDLLFVNEYDKDNQDAYSGFYLKSD